MLTTSVIEGTNVVSVTVDGSISADEDLAAEQVFADVASQHGKARMLLDYDGVDLSRVEPRAVWENLEGSRLLVDIDRMGVLADSKALDAFVEAIGALSGVEAHLRGRSARRCRGLAFLLSCLKSMRSLGGEAARLLATANRQGACQRPGSAGEGHRRSRLAKLAGATPLRACVRIPTRC